MPLFFPTVSTFAVASVVSFFVTVSTFPMCKPAWETAASPGDITFKSWMEDNPAAVAAFAADVETRLPIST